MKAEMKQKKEYGKHKLQGFALKVMESRYSVKPVLSSAECHAFGEKLNVDPQNIEAWFHHKRRYQPDEIVSQHMTQEIRDLINEVGYLSRNDRRNVIDKKQKDALEARFQLGEKISSEERIQLGKSLGLPEYSVRFWFSSRRAKAKRDEKVAEAAKRTVRKLEERRVEQSESNSGLDWLNQIEPLLGSEPQCEPTERIDATGPLGDFPSFGIMNPEFSLASLSAPQNCTSPPPGTGLSSMNDWNANHFGVSGLFLPNATTPHSGFGNDPTATPTDPTIQSNFQSSSQQGFLSPPSIANWSSPSDPKSYSMPHPESAAADFDHSINPQSFSEEFISTQPVHMAQQLAEANSDYATVLNSITDPALAPELTLEILDTSSMEFPYYNKF